MERDLWKRLYELFFVKGKLNWVFGIIFLLMLFWSLIIMDKVFIGLGMYKNFGMLKNCL